MTHEEQLQAEWLKINKPKQYAEADLVYKPYQGKLQLTNPMTQPEICYKSRKRIYTYLNKLSLTESIDETTRNYGN